MSDKLEALIENLSTKEAARLMAVAHEIGAAARAEFEIEVPLDDIAGLVQVRDSVFHSEEGLDATDISNALYNLQQNCPTVRQHLADTAALQAAKRQGADPDSVKIDAETITSVESPGRRMMLARRHNIGVPKSADRGDRRPAEIAPAEYESVARTFDDAVRRMNSARGISQ